jgi:ankyrin repeat protein
MTRNADPAIRNNEGKTAQDIAIERGNREVAERLAKGSR